MAEVEVAPPPKQEEKGFFERMGLFTKIILIIGFAIFAFFVLYFIIGIRSIYQLIFGVIVVGVIIAGMFIVLRSLGIIFAPKYFSPKEDYFTRVTNLAIDLKPDNVRNIYYKGSKDKRRVYAGKIIGLLRIPYLIGDVEKRKDGEPVYIDSRIIEGRKIPKFKEFEHGTEGDTLFVYQKGWFIFKKTHHLRCHQSLHGDLHGDVEIYDVNPNPYGSFFIYPFSQIQREPEKIMIQQQLEIILATHEHQYDLISQGVDAAIQFNPYLRFIKTQQAEISND